TRCAPSPAITAPPRSLSAIVRWRWRRCGGARRRAPPRFSPTSKPFPWACSIPSTRPGERSGDIWTPPTSGSGAMAGNPTAHPPGAILLWGVEGRGRAATPDEIEAMRGIVRDGLQAGALGLSVSKNRGHYDPQGVHIPAFWAEEAEIFALADVLSELGVGTIQSGGGRDAELHNRLMTRLAGACGRQLVYNNLGQSVRQPG